MSETTKLILTEVESNHNKFWTATLDGASVTFTWGRVGESAQSTTKTFTDEDRARKEYDRKCREKAAKGYTVQATLGATPVHAETRDLRAIAHAQIQHGGDAVVKELIDFLVSRNIHTIQSSANIRYDESTGQLTTALGPVTDEGLDRAEALLDEIADCVTVNHCADQRFSDIVNRYLRIVPQRISRRRQAARDIFPDAQTVREQKNLIDTLRSVVKSIADTVVSTAPVVFRTALTLVADDSPEFRGIAKHFEAGRNDRHVSARLKLRRVYRIDIAGMSEAFDRDGEKIGNVKRLWHGTKDANLLSILKGGYVVPKHGGKIAVTGRMYGDGVYFSDQSTKALNYATGFWGGQASQRTFMLLNDVAMGREFIATRSFQGGCPTGYDSTFAKAGQSGVMNNEMIVYRLSQIRPRYLCEFN